MRKRPLIAVALIILAAAGSAFAYRSAIRDALAARLKPQLPPALPFQPSVTEVAPPDATATPPAPAPAKPAAPAPKPSVAAATQANLAVPFTSQAPHADWGMPYQEACEEASLIMVNAYYKNAGAFTPDDADRQILAMVAWEKQRFGYYEDTTADEVAIIAKEYYGYAHARAVDIRSIDDVKRTIDQGLPVLLPAAGRLLGNPYFSGQGPVYHMLVVKGYTKDGKIITNDPGTRHGADYLYDPAVLWNAVHDWNASDITQGRKVMVVVEK